MAKRTDIEFSNKNPGAPGGPDDPDRNNDKILKALIGINENVSKLYSFLKTQNISGVNAQTRDYVKSQINANNANANSNNTNNTFDAAAKERIKSMKLDNKIKREKIKQNEEEKRQKLEIEKNKEKRAIELYKRQLEKDDLEKKILKEQAENGRKERNRNRYKEGTAYKTFSNIKSQPSNVASSIGLSVATGGLINPVIAKTLGLDKIVTAGVKLAGRTVGNVTGRIYDATLGSMFKNITNPFTNQDSYLNKNLDKGSNAVKNTFGNSWFGAFNKNKKEGAIAKNEEENNPIVKEQKKTNTILEHLEKGLTKEEKEEKKEGGGLLGKILQAIGGFGTILKGAAIAAIPHVVKTFFPKIAKWLDDKFKGFLNGTIGLSESTTEGVSQLVKDALPGALFGMTVGGWKGMVIGAGLSIGANWINDKIQEIINGTNKDTIPAKIGPFDASTVESAIGGATVGALFGLKGMAVGAVCGLAGDLLLDTINNWKTIFTGKGEVNNSLGDYFQGALSGAVAALLAGKKSPKQLAIGAVLGMAIPWVTQQINDWKNILTGKGEKVDNKNLKDEIISGAIAGAMLGAPTPMGMAIGALIGIASPSLKALATNWEDVISSISNALKTVKNTALKLISKIPGLGWVADYINEVDSTGGTLGITKATLDYKNGNIDFNEAGKFKSLNETFKNASGGDLLKNTKSSGQLKTGNEGPLSLDPSLMPSVLGVSVIDPNSGGYGTLGPISNGKNNIIHGIPTAGLKELSLAGNVVSSNSIPYIAEENKESLKNLDKIISGWGYDIVYTSAMGGHKTGTGHWKGNKVDLQLKKNGRPTHLTGEQLYALKKAGYWGPGTGALGWEPVYGQVGGGHYDLFIGNGSNTGSIQLASNQLKLDTQTMPTAAENQYTAMNMMNETTQATAEAQEVSSGGIMDLLGNISNGVATTAENTTSSINNMFSGLSISSAGSQNQGQNLSFSIPNTNGGAGSSTGSVYQFGDVAKTPILYTL